MKKLLLTILIVLAFFARSFGQSCDVTVDGHSICDFAITDFYGITEPALSAPGTGRRYFDQAENKFKCSEDGQSYVNCIGSGSGGGSANIGIDFDDINSTTQVGTLDFRSYFTGTENPSGEINVKFTVFDSDTNSATPTAGNLLIGNSQYFNSVNLSGDATLSQAGVLDLSTDSVGVNEIEFLNASTATRGNIIIADGNNYFV